MRDSQEPPASYSIHRLLESFELYKRLVDIEGDLIYEIAGESSFEEPMDVDLFVDTELFIRESYWAVMQLSPRARSGRLNSRWRAFAEKQRIGHNKFQEGKSKKGASSQILRGNDEKLPS